MIGNCSYLSYIDKRANVVWQCWPHFDSDFLFGSLLDSDKGGAFSICPAEESYSSHQYYLENTNVLVTQFESASGSFRVVDFAPRFEMYERWHKPLKLFRKVEKVSGNPIVKIKCIPVCDHGKKQGQPVYGGSNHISYEGLPYKLRLTTNVSKSDIVNQKSFLLTENKYLVLSYNSEMSMPLTSMFEEFLRKTVDYWRTWVRRATIPYFFQNEVIRSALLLKLHQFEDTGAIIASGTTSLPEHPGSQRNWDYRYCWIRDAYFTLSALNSLSHFDEMEAYAHYIQNVVVNSPRSLQPVYGIDGSSKLDESVLDLKGYLGNQPVRFGNAAYTQVQNDVYGQVILTLLPLFIDGRVKWEPQALLPLVEDLLNMIEEKMSEEDAGIWEYRAKKQLHAGTLTFHWAGLKAVMRISKHISNSTLEKKAQHLLTKVNSLIEECYDPKTSSYVAAKNSDYHNASEFLLITMNYLKSSPEKAKTHLEAMEKALKSDNDFIFRYRDTDDFGETHSSFMICGFWYAEALACVGRIDDAQEIFTKLVNTGNHLGILSEDIDPSDRSQWGNFAQTYSHVGLINAAFRISSKLDRLIFE